MAEDQDEDLSPKGRSAPPAVALRPKPPQPRPRPRRLWRWLAYVTGALTAGEPGQIYDLDGQDPHDEEGAG